MPEVHPSLLKRKIIHIDMDAFYASIEVRDRPELAGKPIAVGGRAEGRGVIATASYEARRFGVRSAMPTRQALKLCPDLILIKPRFDAYRAASREIRAVFHEYTPLVEPLSLDEAYLDVTGHADGLLASDIARRIRIAILDRTRITASAGVGPNKMVAKIASDVRKPNGMTVVPPQAVFDFMMPLAVRRIPGVGPVSAQKLEAIGIRTCRDAHEFELEKLHEAFGERFANWLKVRAQGIDERPVESVRVRKSLGVETTFPTDLTSLDDARQSLDELIEEVVRRAEAAGVKGGTVTLKVKYHQFKSVTRAITLAFPTRDTNLITSTIEQLLAKTDVGTVAVRLLGVTLSALIEDDASGAPQFYQPSLFD